MNRRNLTILSIVCLVFQSNIVYAWGPAAHIEVSLQLLCGAGAVSPLVFNLISKYRDDFFYGALAADIIIGKNRVESHNHCHSWKVARELYIKSQKEGEPRQAFILGYLSHLGADIVAHNNFVPSMIVTNFSQRGAGHLYWETRADHMMFEYDKDIVPTWKQLLKTNFKGHEAFLKRNLVSSIMSNGISLQVYKRNLKIQQGVPWKKAIKTLNKSSKLLLKKEDLDLWRYMSVRKAAMAINDPFNPQLDNDDPVGHAALLSAINYRKKIRASLRRSTKDTHQKLFLRALNKYSLK